LQYQIYPVLATNLKLSATETATNTAVPSRLRIAILDHTARMGGGEIALLNLARYIDPNRFSLLVILFAEGPLNQKLRDAKIETLIVPLDPRIADARKDAIGGKSLARLGDVKRTLQFVRQLAGVLRQQKIDLVHTNSLKSDLLGGLAGRWARIPVIWHIRDRISSDYLPKPVAILFRLLARIIPTHVIAISYAVLNTLRIRNADDPAPWVNQRFTVVHDGTEVPPLPESTDPNQLIVGLVGRISPWKGQHIFLNAIALIRDRFPQARYQIIGSALFSEGDYEKDIRQLCTTLGLDPIVDFLGFRDDVPALIAKLDLLVHASTVGEPFGQVIIEGMAAGKPIVATRGGGVPEFVEPGTGTLVPMDDAPALAAAMAGYLADRNLRIQTGQRARQHIIDSFTIARTAEKVQNIYDQM
jgi:glycosyltransferase involved in cell wall biosynthesis